MGLTFQEESLRLTSISLVVGFGLYIGAVLPTHAVNLMPSQMVLVDRHSDPTRGGFPDRARVRGSARAGVQVRRGVRRRGAC